MLSIVQDLEAAKPECVPTETAYRVQEDYGILLFSESMQILFLNQRAKVLLDLQALGGRTSDQLLVSTELMALGQWVGRRLQTDRAARIHRQFEVARVIIVGERSLASRAIGLPGADAERGAKILLLLKNLVSPTGSSIRS